MHRYPHNRSNQAALSNVTKGYVVLQILHRVSMKVETLNCQMNNSICTLCTSQRNGQAQKGKFAMHAASIEPGTYTTVEFQPQNQPNPAVQFSLFHTQYAGNGLAAMEMCL